MRTDGQTDMTRSTAALRNFVNAPKPHNLFIGFPVIFFISRTYERRKSNVVYSFYFFSAHFAAAWTLLPTAAAPFKGPPPPPPAMPLFAIDTMTLQQSFLCEFRSSPVNYHSTNIHTYVHSSITAAACNTPTAMVP
jgi:hypothetical protein